MNVLKTLAAVFASAMVVPSAGAAEAAYPTHPVRMVVPFPPGAASDFLARVLGQKLTESWGQQIVVDNRPGAGGLIGSTAVAHANPDGYTIALIGQPHLTAVLLSKSPPWDPFKDFTHIGGVASMPNVAVVGPGLQVNSLPELINQVRGKPGFFNFGSAGVGSSSHLAAEMFNSAANLKSVHVPFKLLGDALAEMYGGRVHYYLFPLPAAMPALRDGKLKPIATGGAKRAVALPQVPTMGEAGLPGFVSETYFGLLGPAGMSKTITAKINADVVKYLNAEDMRQRYLTNGAEPMPTTPADFEKVQRTEYQRVKKVVTDIDLKPQF